MAMQQRVPPRGRPGPRRKKVELEPWSTYWSEIERQVGLWEADGETNLYLKNLVDRSEEYASGEVKAVMEAQLVTGIRVEYQRKPLVKAAQVYFDHDAIEGVPKDAVVDPRRILSSRFVLQQGWRDAG